VPLHKRLVDPDKMNQQTITPIEKVLYTAKAHTTGGCDAGASRTSDCGLDVKLSTPGTSGTGTNPER
jgi:osmotically inducible protein OsmC